MDSISERLALAEDELVAAAMEGGAALTRFYERLGTLLADVERATSTGDIDDSTLDSWSESTLRLTQLNQSLLQLEELSSTIRAEVATAFAKVDLTHLAGPSSSKAQRKRRTDTQSSSAGEEKKIPDYRGSPYIETAYQWLLSNLHNPYPSKQTRDGIAQQTGTSRELIDAWFISTRQRIGWTALRKNRFSNKRADIVKAAGLFFSPENHLEALDPLLEIDFASMESMAKELYGGRFSDEGYTVTELNRPSHKHRHKEKKRTARRHNPYPSPDHSCDETEMPSSRQGSHETLDSPQEIRPTRTWKRRISLSGSESDQHTSSSWPRSPTHAGPALPSPEPSELDTYSTDAEIQPPECFARPFPPTRKRRLSDAQSQQPSKRARTASPNPSSQRGISPDAQTATDTSNLDDWFERNTTLPVNILGIDLDVEVFNYGHSEAASPSSVPSGMGPITPDSSFVGSSLGVASSDISIPDRLDIATQSADYSHLFDDLEDISNQIGQIGTVDSAMAQWNFEKSIPLTQMTPLSYSSLETDLHPTLSDLDPLLEPTSYDFSDWFANTQAHLPPAGNGDLVSILPSTSISDFNQTQMTFGDFSQFFPLPSSSQEEKRRRLEEIRAEALRLEQELANS